MRKNAAVLLVCLLAGIAVYVSGLLDCRKVWDLLAPDEEKSLCFNEGMGPDLQGEKYGEVSYGPWLTLPPGHYALTYRITGDGQNHLQIGNSNGADMQPGSIELTPEKPEGTVDFYIHDTAEHVSFKVMYESGSRLHIEKLVLTSPAYKDHAFTAAFLFIGAGILYILWRRGIRQYAFLIPIVFAIFFASIPSLKASTSLIHDTVFHTARFYNIADGLRLGQFPVRCGGFSYDGFGAITSAFYSDFFLYPCGIMLLLHASPTYVMNFYLMSVNWIAAACMYACAKGILKKREMAVLASVLYVLAVYRLTDSYVRAAIGETTAMSFLPLFVWGLWEAIFGDSKKWRLLGVSASLIFLCHMISTLICITLVLLMAVPNVFRILREKRLLPMIKAAVLALLLCLFFIVPFLMYSMEGIGAQEIQGKLADTLMSPAQFFLWGVGDMPVDPMDKTLSGLPAEPGLPLWLGLLFAAYVLLTQKVEKNEQKMILRFTGLGLLGVLFSSTLFPWGRISTITHGIVDYIQFAWRFMMLTVVFFSLIAAWGAMRLAGDRKNMMLLGMSILTLIFVLPTQSEQTLPLDYIPFGEVTTSHMTYPEYTLPGSNLRITQDRRPLLSGKIEMDDYRKDGTRITAHVKGEDGEITFPLFAFDGYQATLDGKKIDCSQGENCRLKVTFSGKVDGMVKVWFAGKPLWRVADAISCATLVLLLLDTKRRRGGRA